jgi:hypothetical protein
MGPKTVERAATDVMYWGTPAVTMHFQNRTVMSDNKGTSQQPKRKTYSMSWEHVSYSQKI